MPLVMTDMTLSRVQDLQSSLNGRDAVRSVLQALDPTEIRATLERLFGLSTQPQRGRDGLVIGEGKFGPRHPLG